MAGEVRADRGEGAAGVTEHDALEREHVAALALAQAFGQRHRLGDRGPCRRAAPVRLVCARERGMPIVPVAFRGGVDGVSRHDVPAAAQVHHIGRPILPETLAALPYADRRRAIADAINALGVPAPIAPRTEPVAPGAGIRAVLTTVESGPIRDLLDGKPLPDGAAGAWLAELGRLVG
jgi:hypothetical protein